MRARWLVFAAVVVTAAGFFDWRMRTAASRDGAGPAPSAGWLERVHQRTLAADQLGYVYEIVAEMADEPAVVVHEEGAFDRAAGQMWRTVAVARGDETRSPFRMVVGASGVWLTPGHFAERFGLDPAAWVGTAFRDVGEERWVARLSQSAESLRDLVLDTDGHAVVVGREQVGGVAATRVRLRGKTPLDIWVDAEDRLRRVEVRLTPSPAATSGASVLTMRLELSDYDRPVTVEPPDPAQVIDDAALVEMLLSRLPGRPGEPSEALGEELVDVDHDPGDLARGDQATVVVG